MPVPVSFPGVYIEEIPSGVHTITGVATSITAFIGRARKGPLNEPVIVTSNADYERTFGGLSRSSSMSYAVRQFFDNGGGQAVIVRVATATATAATIPLDATLPANNVILSAASVGTWGRNLVATVDLNTKTPADQKLFNLTIFDDPALKLDGEGRGGSGHDSSRRSDGSPKGDDTYRSGGSGFRQRRRGYHRHRGAGP